MSWITFAAPAVALVAVLAFYFVRKSSVKASLTQYEPFVLATLAPRLGLRIVAGDPTANLLLPPQNMGNVKYQDNRFEWNVRLEGAPRGRSVVVEHYELREVEAGFAETRWRHTTRIHMSAETRWSGQIEITSKRGSLGAPTRSLPLPISSFGDSMLDAELVLGAADASVGPKIREHVHAIDSSLRAYGLHLVVDQAMVSVRATQRSAMGVLYFVESTLPILEDIATALERG